MSPSSSPNENKLSRQDIYAVEFEGHFRVVEASRPVEACLIAARKSKRACRDGQFVLVGDTYRATSLSKHETHEIFVSKDVLLKELNQ